MPPVRFMKGVRLDSDLRGHRVEPVSWLRVTQDIPIVEYERFEPHACSNVSRSDDQSVIVEVHGMPNLAQGLLGDAPSSLRAFLKDSDDVFRGPAKLLPTGPNGRQEVFKCLD
jgi:hypothetical protein